MGTSCWGLENIFYYIFQLKMCMNNTEPKDNSLYPSFSHSTNIKLLVHAKHYFRCRGYSREQNKQNPCLSEVYILGVEMENKQEHNITSSDSALKKNRVVEPAI